MTRSAAVLTIKDASEMTEQGAKAIAAWLRKQAKALERDRKAYAAVHRARYLYSDDA